MRIAAAAGGFVLLAGTLTACGGPSPTRLAMTVTASAGLNPNSKNQPSPTTIAIYDLKSPTAFTSADFDALYYDGSATLGADLLGRKQLSMLPGQSFVLKDNAAPGTNFIGVVAGFRSPEGGAWRALLPITRGERNKIEIHLAPTSVTIAEPPPGGWF